MRNQLHCLRPLVEAGKWDYLVVWELGDDPSRFIQWVGCCCSGAHGVCENVKDETKIVSLCKDTFFKHSASSKPCRELSMFPPSIPLYCGIHGETVLSTETRWLNISTKDSSSYLCHARNIFQQKTEFYSEVVLLDTYIAYRSATSTVFSPFNEELSGTRVLIPVVGGLVELFATRNVPKDERVIEFVTSRCKIKKENEVVAAQSYPDTYLHAQPLTSFFDQYSRNGASLFKSLNINYGPKLPIIPTPSQLSTYPSLEGSSTGSNPTTHEHLSLNSYSGHVSPNGSVTELIEKRHIYTTPNRDSNVSLENMYVSAVECVNHNALIERENVNVAMKMETEPYQSKNLITERKRRNRIKDGLLTLRSLVPKISKMDKASILVDAIAYIEELHKEKKKLEDELEDTAKDGNKKKTDLVLIRKSDSEIGGNPKKRNRDQSSAHETKQISVQIEVNQIGKRAFLVKLVGAYKQGGFMRLMEGLYTLDLQVIDMSTTTFDGEMMNIFKVEVTKSGVQPKSLKESLIKLTGNLHS